MGGAGDLVARIQFIVVAWFYNFSLLALVGLAASRLLRIQFEFRFFRVRVRVWVRVRVRVVGATMRIVVDLAHRCSWIYSRYYPSGAHFRR